MALLAINDRAVNLSLCGQLASMILAFVIGRWFLRRHAIILLVSVLGAVGAMFANIVVDGQGAFLFIIYAPVIYLAAIVGRRNLIR